MLICKQRFHKLLLIWIIYAQLYGLKYVYTQPICQVQDETQG